MGFIMLLFVLYLLFCIIPAQMAETRGRRDYSKCPVEKGAFRSKLFQLLHQKNDLK